MILGRCVSLGVLALLTVGSVAVAETLPSEGAPESATQLEAQSATKFVNEKLGVWQQRLNLQQWRITIVMTRREGLKPKTLGGIHWDKSKKSAVVAVLDPSEYQVAYRDMLKDMEFTIVHELVHLELASLPKSEASRSTEEHAVNQIAEALLALDRHREMAISPTAPIGDK